MELQFKVLMKRVFQTWSKSVHVIENFKNQSMNVPAIIALTGIVTALLVASCCYVCKKRHVEPIEMEQQTNEADAE